MENRKENFAFWLVPAARERECFASIIRDLGLRLDAPIFVPHLTLHGGDVPQDLARNALLTVAMRSSYDLEVDGIDCSEKFTKTLFVRFGQSKQVDELRAAIGHALQLPTTAAFDPHLSLLYKEMPLSKKAELTHTIKLPFQRVSFIDLSLIAHPVEIVSRADVEAWRTIAKRESSR